MSFIIIHTSSNLFHIFCINFQDLKELFMQAGGQKKLKKLSLSLIGFEKLLDLLGKKHFMS